VVTLSGRDFYLGPHGTQASKREYDRLIGEWLANGRHPLHISVADLSVDELCARYLKYSRSRYVKNGRLTGEWCAIRSALRYARKLYLRQPAAEFGPLALKAVRNSMIAADLAATSINQHVGRIRRMFRWGVAEQLVRPDVYQALIALPGLRKGRGEARETKPILPVGDATVEATLPQLPDVVADMVRFQRYTGCRPAEVCILRPCDVDRSSEVWRYVPESHKCEHHGRERVIFIGPKAQVVLLRYLARDPQATCFRPTDSEAKRRAEQRAHRKTPLSCGTKRATDTNGSPNESRVPSMRQTFTGGRLPALATRPAFHVGRPTSCGTRRGPKFAGNLASRRPA
jgi:integrase